MDKLPVRKNIRLTGFDYSAGGSFFITICIQNHECLFGHIDDDGINHLNHLGKIANDLLLNIPNIYHDVYIGSYVIMPNHIHFIINIHHTANISLSQIIKGYKQFVTKSIRVTNSTFQRQKSYYEKIIRDEFALSGIEEYTFNNPQRRINKIS